MEGVVKPNFVRNSSAGHFFLPERGFGDGNGRAGDLSTAGWRGLGNGARRGTVSRSVRVRIRGPKRAGRSTGTSRARRERRTPNAFVAMNGGGDPPATTRKAAEEASTPTPSQWPPNATTSRASRRNSARTAQILSPPAARSKRSAQLAKDIPVKWDIHSDELGHPETSLRFASVKGGCHQRLIRQFFVSESLFSRREECCGRKFDDEIDVMGSRQGRLLRLFLRIETKWDTAPCVAWVEIGL